MSSVIDTLLDASTTTNISGGISPDDNQASPEPVATETAPNTPSNETTALNNTSFPLASLFPDGDTAYLSDNDPDFEFAPLLDGGVEDPKASGTDADSIYLADVAVGVNEPDGGEQSVLQRLGQKIADDWHSLPEDAGKLLESIGPLQSISEGTLPFREWLGDEMIKGSLGVFPGLSEGQKDEFVDLVSSYPPLRDLVQRAGIDQVSLKIGWASEPADIAPIYFDQSSISLLDLKDPNFVGQLTRQLFMQYAPMKNEYLRGGKEFVSSIVLRNAHSLFHTGLARKTILEETGRDVAPFIAGTEIETAINTFVSSDQSEADYFLVIEDIAKVFRA